MVLRSTLVCCLLTVGLAMPAFAQDAEFRLDIGTIAPEFSPWAEHLASLRFTAEMSRWVAEEQWHPDQRGAFDEEGEWLLEIPFSSPRELIMDILRYGPEVEVLGPEFLRVAVAESARRTASLYPPEPD